MVIAELGCPTYPDRSYYKNNLSQNEIEETEFFFEDSTALLNVSFEFSKGRGKSCLGIGGQETSFELEICNLGVRKAEFNL